jgi:hypothetical protein
MSKDNGYVGKIPNTGAAVIKAPHQVAGGKSTGDRVKKNVVVGSKKK